MYGREQLDSYSGGVSARRGIMLLKASSIIKYQINMCSRRGEANGVFTFEAGKRNNRAGLSDVALAIRGSRRPRGIMRIMRIKLKACDDKSKLVMVMRSEANLRAASLRAHNFTCRPSSWRVRREIKGVSKFAGGTLFRPIRSGAAAIARKCISACVGARRQGADGGALFS